MWRSCGVSRNATRARTRPRLGAQRQIAAVLCPAAVHSGAAQEERPEGVWGCRGDCTRRALRYLVPVGMALRCAVVNGDPFGGAGCTSPLVALAARGTHTTEGVQHHSHTSTSTTSTRWQSQHPKSATSTTPSPGIRTAGRVSV